MEKLGRALRSLATGRSGWTVSAADEAGEGEQKLMAWVRAHREDLAGCADVSAEMEAWKQQAVFQLPRKVSVGGLGQFAKVAIDYVRDAAARMELRRELNGRGAYVKVKTFAEAKQEAISNPMPPSVPRTTGRLVSA